jgi:hypothetical protein
MRRMTSLLPVWRNQRHWELRAEEAHAAAESMSDAEAQRLMMRVAEAYADLARHAASLAASFALLERTQPHTGGRPSVP